MFSSGELHIFLVVLSRIRFQPTRSVFNWDCPRLFVFELKLLGCLSNSFTVLSFALGPPQLFALCAYRQSRVIVQLRRTSRSLSLSTSLRHGASRC